MTVDEMLKIAELAKKQGCGDMDINEYLQELEEYQQDRYERALEEQSEWDAYYESHGSIYDNM